MKLSSIGWTDYSGEALNFIHGCTPASEGCAHCYARAMYKRFGLDFAPTFDADKLARLETLRFPEYSPKRGAPHKPMAFVCDTGDLFHEVVPSDFIREALGIMGRRPDVIWQVLTKRPERLAEFLDCFAYNIWMGITAENQRRLDERLPYLAEWPGTKFISVEPMLEPVDIRRHLGYNIQKETNQNEQRGCALRFGAEWRMANRQPGQDMEAERRRVDQDRAPNSTELSASSQDAQWHPHSYGCASPCVPTFCGADSARDDGESQEWREGRQQAGESRNCELFGEYETRLQNRTQISVGREQSGRQADEHPSRGDSEALCRGGRYAGPAWREIRSNFSDDLGHCEGGSAEEAKGADCGLYMQTTERRSEAQYKGPIQFVICGAESGPNRRPFDALWALDLYAQCKSAGVPFFYKQSGALRPGQEDELPGIGKVKEWPR